MHCFLIMVEVNHLCEGFRSEMHETKQEVFSIIILKVFSVAQTCFVSTKEVTMFKKMHRPLTHSSLCLVRRCLALKYVTFLAVWFPLLLRGLRAVQSPVWLMFFLSILKSRLWWCPLAPLRALFSPISSWRSKEGLPSFPQPLAWLSFIWGLCDEYTTFLC